MKFGAIVLVLLAGLPVMSQSEPSSLVGIVRSLKPGDSVNSKLRGGDLHTYQMTMTAGQYVRVAIDHGDLALSMKVIAPNGEKLFEGLAPYSAQDAAHISVIAQSSGFYLVQLAALKQESNFKQYSIRIEELHEATTSDQSRTAAERLFTDAETLRVNGSASDLHAALQRYRSALDMWRTLGQRRDEAYTLFVLGSVSHNLSQPKDALAYYNEALTLWRSLGDRRKEGLTLSGMGWTYYSIGNLQKALEYYDQALPIRRDLGDLRGQAQTLTTIGQIYKSLGEPQKAIEHYNLSLPLARQAGDKIQEAFALGNFALLYIDLAEYQRALTYVDQALPLWRETGNRYGEADTLNSAGIIYDELGEFEKALDHYHRSLELWRHLGNQHGEADVLNNMGIAYVSMDELQDSPDLLPKALDALNQALAIRRSTGQLLGETDTLVNLGLAYERLGKRDAALDYFNQVLKIDPSSPTALHNIGVNYYLRNDPQRALEYFRRALAISRERGSRSGEAQTLGMMAEVQAKLGNLNDALSNSRAALDIIDSLWSTIASSEVRTSYHAVTRDYYVQLIDLLFQENSLHPGDKQDVVALEINERARARGLIDLLLERRVDIRDNTSDALLERELFLRRQLGAKEKYRRRLLDDRNADAERLAVENDLQFLGNEYLETRASIQASNSRYAAIAQPPTLSVQQIQENILDSDTVLLEYCLGNSRSFLWMVTKTSMSSHSLPGLAEIQGAARRVYDLLTERNNHPRGESPQQRVARISRADAEYNEASLALSQMLLGTVAAELGQKRLVFVTDGILQYIPFSALPKPLPAGGRRTKSDVAQFRPLIMDHEIVSLPSASVLAILRRDSADRQTAPKSIAVIADPVFSKDDPRVDAHAPKIVSTSQPIRSTFDPGSPTDSSDLDFKTARFGRLRFSREEADEIVSLAPAATSLKLTDFAASTETVMSSNLAQYRILHFATHGLLDSRRPEQSGLVLSRVDDQGNSRNGFLGLREIYNMRLNADLIVLSGCQTALGKEIKGEGLVGLTRGFMYAGVPRVVASLWSVEDRATADLMKRFYRGVLTQGMRPAAALRAAQAELRQERGWVAPYFWAGFTLQGDWR